MREPGTLLLVCLDVYERQSDEGDGVHVVVKLPYDPVVSACNSDGGFVALHLADAVKLGNLIALLYIPSHKDGTEFRLFKQWGEK